MTGEAYKQSALLAQRLGAFKGYRDARCVHVEKAVRQGSCTLIGGGQCPADLDSSLEQSLSLDPGAVMRLSFEVFDRNFVPGRRNAQLARGVFHVDPPYAYGDDDLGNNVAVINSALGGVSIGFE